MFTYFTLKYNSINCKKTLVVIKLLYINKSCCSKSVYINADKKGWICKLSIIFLWKYFSVTS